MVDYTGSEIAGKSASAATDTDVRANGKVSPGIDVAAPIDIQCVALERTIDASVEEKIAEFKSGIATLLGALSRLARAVLLHELYCLYAEIHAHLGRGHAPGRAGGGKVPTKTDKLSFFAWMAEILGYSEKTVRRYHTIGSGIDPSVRKAIVAGGTGLSNDGGMLLRIAGLSTEKQMRVATTALAGMEAAKALLDELDPPTSAHQARVSLPPTLLTAMNGNSVEIPKGYRVPILKIVALSGDLVHMEVSEGAIDSSDTKSTEAPTVEQVAPGASKNVGAHIDEPQKGTVPDAKERKRDGVATETSGTTVMAPVEAPSLAKIDFEAKLAGDPHGASLQPTAPESVTSTDEPLAAREAPPVVSATDQTIIFVSRAHLVAVWDGVQEVEIPTEFELANSMDNLKLLLGEGTTAFLELSNGPLAEIKRKFSGHGCRVLDHEPESRQSSIADQVCLVSYSPLVSPANPQQSKLIVLGHLDGGGRLLDSTVVVPTPSGNKRFEREVLERITKYSLRFAVVVPGDANGSGQVKS